MQIRPVLRGLLGSALPLALALHALPARAGDGVIEINHTLAVAGGATPGDTPGYPVEIFAPGSYRLTGNLQQPAQNTDVVVVRADGVVLDLNGFSIQGTNRCQGSPLSCEQSGSGDGVAFAPLPGDVFANRLATIVRNGTIRGVAGNGVSAPGGAVSIHDVLVVHAGRNGIDTSNAARIRNCSAFENGGDGIEATAPAVISGNHVQRNGANGIHTTGAFPGGIVSGNLAHLNGGIGIFIDGLAASVQGNTITNNVGIGLRMDSTTIGYGHNVLASNDGGGSNVQVQGGTALASNLCNGAGC